ncbi:MAG TPA: trypsin-like peptidase domain-containing protein, partial [Rhodopila sp.]|nr:trypsin-like peptidase domain-containing protein [Rhodopila sp.]
MSGTTTEYPYDTVVRITDTIGGISWQASGVLIAPDEVLTASHVVYSAGVGTASNIVVVPGYDYGTSPYGAYYGTSIHYLPVDDAGDLISQDQSQYDYAVIHLSQPVAGAGYMGLLPNYAGGLVSVTGYPAYVGGIQINSSQLVYRDPNYTLLDGTSIGPGSSGGPVWVEYDGGPYVVGLVSSSTIFGTGYNALITTAAFNQIEAWVRQDDASASTGPSPASSAVSDNFFDSGASGILFENASGQMAAWDVHNGLATSASGLGGLSAGWAVAGTGNFYGTGGTDILFANTNGDIAQWQVVAGRAITATNLGVMASGWTVAGTGDFYGNGTDDVLFRYSNGTIAQWKVQDGKTIGATTVGTTDDNWTIAATGKLTGADNTDDILFISNSGAVADWSIQNGAAVAGNSLGQTSAYWSIVGLGDFTGDGQNDILFRGQGGEIAMWLVNNGVVTGDQDIGRTDNSWQIAGL